MSKKKSPEGGLVYSTNPNFKLKEEVEEAKTPGASQQDLRVWLERKGGGKMVTLVKGFQGKLSDFDDLAKALKSLWFKAKLSKSRSSEKRVLP